MSEVQEALKEWQKTITNRSNCCGRLHYRTLGMGGDGRPMEDEDVCKRELSWRKYVRLRDENSNWPFNVIELPSEEEEPISCNGVSAMLRKYR